MGRSKDLPLRKQYVEAGLQTRLTRVLFERSRSRSEAGSPEPEARSPTRPEARSLKPVARSEPHRYPLRLEVALEIGHARLGVVEDGCGQRRVGGAACEDVQEMVEGAGAADSALDKNSKAAAGVSQMFGAEKALPSSIDPTNLVAAQSGTQFKGSGATSRSGTLSATIPAPA